MGNARVHKQTQIIHVHIPQDTNYIQINYEDMQLVNVSTDELRQLKESIERIP